MILVDANIFMYAAGAAHRCKIPSVRFLHEAARLGHACCLNTEVLQEILRRYRAIGRWEEGREVFQLARRIVPTVEPVTAAILDRTVEIMDTYPRLMARDCLHAAHCLVAGLEGICSFDTDFDKITEITRIEPEA